MIGNFFASSKGKSCPCCAACKAYTKSTPNKKTKGKSKFHNFLRSHTFNKEARHQPVSLVLRKNPLKNHDKIHQNQNHDKIKHRSRVKSRKRQYERKPHRFLDIRRWYKRRKSLNQLIKENKKECRRQEEYIKERIKDILRREQEIKKYEQKLRLVAIEEKKKEICKIEKKDESQSWTEPKRAKEKSWPISKISKKQDVDIKEAEYKPVSVSVRTKTQKEKRNYSKDQSATAKPQYVSKDVSVKTCNHKDSVANRFVNCCYRVCCQCYCCITCVIVIASVFMCIL